MTRHFTILAAAGLTLGCGCSGEPERTAAVRGRVTLGGQPLPGGRLLLKSLAANPQVMQAAVDLDPDGSFFINESPIGPVAVALDTEVVRTDILPNRDPADGPAKVKFVPIPAKYRSFDTSGLGFEVKPGTQVRDFALDP